MNSARWQWNDYRYCREKLKWMLTQFSGPVEQLRVLRGQLRRFSRCARSCERNGELRYFVYALAYIERAPAFDRLSLMLERQAMACLFGSGVKPPKSQLSYLFAELFNARVMALTETKIRRRTGHSRAGTCQPSSLLSCPLAPLATNAIPLRLYQLLRHYCDRQSPVVPCTPTVLGEPPQPVLPVSTNTVSAIRRYRFAGKLVVAQRMARQSASAQALGERVLIQGQLKGSLRTLSTLDDGVLSRDQLAEWWLLAYAVNSRRWVNTLPEQTSVSPPLWEALYALKGFYCYDLPLLQRLYDYVRFQLERRIDNPLLDTYFSAACLRWLFRSNQVTFARQEACRYQALSRVISRGATLDALGVMGDVLARLFPV